MKSNQKGSILAILIGISSLLITGCFAVSNFMKRDMVIFASNSSNLINILMDAIDIQDEKMSKQQYNELVLLENTIRNDERLYELSEKMTPLLVHDLLFTSDQDMAFIKDDFINIIGDYEKQLVMYFPNPAANKDMIIKNIDQLSINAIYQQQITRIRSHIPMVLNLILLMIYILSLPIVILVVILLFVISNVAWYWLYKKSHNSLLSLSLSYQIAGAFILFIFFTSKIAATAFPTTLLYHIGTLHPSTFYIIGVFGALYIMNGIWLYVTHRRRVL